MVDRTILLKKCLDSIARSPRRAPRSQVYRIGDHVVKIYRVRGDGWYEFNVLTTISRLHPTAYRVPVPIGIRENGTFLLMEYVGGSGFALKPILAMFAKRSRDIDLFRNLGIALKSFHSIEADGFREIERVPGDPGALKAHIAQLVKALANDGELDAKLADQVLNYIGGIAMDNRIFAKVTLHGDLHFWNLRVLDGKPVFLDLNQAGRGPCYRDLAMLTLGLYMPLFCPYISAKRVRHLAHAFMSGYYGQEYSTRLARSLKVCELYEALRQIEALRFIRDKSGFRGCISGVWMKLKVQRLNAIIENSCEGST